MIRVACVVVVSAVLADIITWLSIPLVLDLMVRVYGG